MEGVTIFWYEAPAAVTFGMKSRMNESLSSRMLIIYGDGIV